MDVAVFGPPVLRVGPPKKGCGGQGVLSPAAAALLAWGCDGLETAHL